MNNLVRYRAMESLCRQSAVFHPLESWRLLAEAEMWHHKAQEEIASLSVTAGAMTSGAMTSGAMTSGAMTSGAMASNAIHPAVLSRPS